MSNADTSYDLTVAQSARLCKASEPQLRNAIKDGRLPHARIGGRIYLNAGDVTQAFGRA